MKLRLQEAQVAALRQSLQKQAFFTSRSEQVDTYFSHPCRDLVAADEALRLRQGGPGLEITYKGPREGGDLKARPETNVGVTGDAAALLQALGFQPVARLTKQREHWEMPRVEVALDHVAGLGWFVELEAEQGHADAAGVIRSARRLLGLDGAEAVQESYLGMALAAGAAGVQRL